jgi:uncharacterized membrane protein YfcA
MVTLGGGFWLSEAKTLVACPPDSASVSNLPPLTSMALDRSSRYGWGMKTNWPWWIWVLIVAGVLVAVSFLGALILALSGMTKAWITVALAAALIVVVVLQLRRYLPNAKRPQGRSAPSM